MEKEIKDTLIFVFFRIKSIGILKGAAYYTFQWKHFMVWINYKICKYSHVTGMLQLQRRVIINNAQFGTDARIMSVEPLHVYIIVDDPTLNTHTHTLWNLRGAAVALWTTKRRPGFAVYLSSLTSFVRDSKWGCRL